MFFVAMRRYEPLDLNRGACRVLLIKGGLRVGSLEHLFMLRRWRVWKYEEQILGLEIESKRLEKSSKQGRGGIIVKNEDIRKYLKVLELIEAARVNLLLARQELVVTEAEMLYQKKKQE